MNLLERIAVHIQTDISPHFDEGCLSAYLFSVKKDLKPGRGEIISHSIPDLGIFLSKLLAHGQVDQILWLYQFKNI